MWDGLPTRTANLEVRCDVFGVPPRDSSPAVVAPNPALVYPCVAISLVAVSLRAECRTLAVSLPLAQPLLSTVGASSYYQLRQDINLAAALFQAATRRVAMGSPFHVSAALRDALCTGIVNCTLQCSAREPCLSMMACSPAHRRGAPLAPCRESWDPDPLNRSGRRPLFLCALAPWLLFRYTMAALVAPHAFLWHPNR